MENWTQELKEYFNKPFTSPKIGELVKGKVVKITGEYVFVDIGLKNEAVINISEVKTETGELIVSEGDEIEALVESKTPSENLLLLSYRKVLEKKLREEIEKAYKEKGVIKIKPYLIVKGGYRVMYKDFLKGFMPFSQSYFRKRPENQKELLGKELEVFVLTIDKGNFIVSRRAYLENEFKKKKEKVLEKIKESGIVEGEVVKCVEGGYVVNIEEVLFGFLPFQELAWHKIEDPASYLKIGDKIKVKVIRFDEKKERLRLSIKALLPDPWEEVAEKYKEGDRVRGKVTKVFNKGAFVEIHPGVEGLVPASEISWRKVKVKDVLTEGDIVEGVIIDFRPQEKKMALSLKKLEPNPWEVLASEVKPGDILGGKIKTVTDYGLFVEIKEGIEGFVHISNVSWERVENLKGLFKPEDEVMVKVLEIDPEKKRLQLSIKHLKPDPWEEISDKVKVGDVVEGVVKEVQDKGLQVEVFPGIRAFVPLREIDEERHKEKLLKKFKPGDKIEAKVILFEPENRRFVLSRVQYLKEVGEKELKNFKQKVEKGGIMTLGDILKAKLKEIKSA